MFYLLDSPCLDAVQKAAKTVDFRDFTEQAVYGYMARTQIVSLFLSREKVAQRQPRNLCELAYCHSDLVAARVTKRNLPH